MTEANRLTHYRLLVPAFLWVNTIICAEPTLSCWLLVPAFLWVNTMCGCSTPSWHKAVSASIFVGKHNSRTPVVTAFLAVSASIFVGKHNACQSVH